MASSASLPAFDPIDPAGIDAFLSDDEKDVRASVRQLLADRVEPHVAGWFEAAHVEDIRGLVKEFRATMAAGGLQESDLTATASAMWSVLQLFAKAQATLSDQATGAEALENMYTISNETLGGLIPPITFTKGQPAQPRDCFYSVNFVDGKLTAPLGGLKFDCYPSKN